MAKISKIMISEYLGIEELNLEPEKIHIFKGPKGIGKSSIIESIEKAFRNKNRRSEIIRDGAEEAKIFVRLDNGLEVTRKIRRDKQDTLKIRKDNEGVSQTEKFLRSLCNDIQFNPIDWIRMNKKEQTEHLLSLIKVEWTMDNIKTWFGEIPKDIDYDKHILTIIKDIQLHYYKTREEVNRGIKEVKASIDSLYSGLPLNYDGERWRNENINNYYKKIYEGEEKNRRIKEGREIREGFNTFISEKNLEYERVVHNIEISFKDKKEELSQKISWINKDKENINRTINAFKEREELEMEKLNGAYEREHQALIQKYAILRENKKKEIYEDLEYNKEKLMEYDNELSHVKKEILGLSEKMEGELKLQEVKFSSIIENEKVKLGEARMFLVKHNEVDIKPLIDEAEHVNLMINNLKDWDRIIELRDNKLSPKERYAKDLTFKIEKARSLPEEILKTTKMPVNDLTMDVNGQIRIGGRLIDGLSDGEKLDVAMRVARESCGDLKIICIDRFECLDKDSQERLLEEMEKDDYQYFITQVGETCGNNLEIEKRGEFKNE
ncbi:MAG: hypothetical protein ACRC7N_06230 [Clostridium sp.]